MPAQNNLPRIVAFSTKVRPGEEFHPITVFGVEVTTTDASWHEPFATKAEVDAFLRGMQAGSQMTGGPYLHVPLEITERKAP